LSGALYQMINHAITAGALFILIQNLYAQKGTFDIEEVGGLAKVLPWYAFFFVVAGMGAVALPGTGSFIGEWLILLGAFKAHMGLGVGAVLGVVLGAIYILWIMFKVLFGPLKTEQDFKLKGLKTGEVVQLSLLSVLIFVFGFASAPLLQHTQNTLAHIHQSLSQKIPYKSSLIMWEGEEIPYVRFSHKE
jgi:NADH-quinone oxidoreductase subunit M